MRQYVFGFFLTTEQPEILLRFPRFPEIISAIDLSTFGAMSVDEVERYAHDAVITALQAVIALREEIPATDDPALVRADGFVHLPVIQSMKLELFRIYRANCNSVAEFARLHGKSETAVHRLLNLRHASRASEIERAVELFGKRLVHAWSLESSTLRTDTGRFWRSRVSA